MTGGVLLAIVLGVALGMLILWCLAPDPCPYCNDDGDPCLQCGQGGKDG